MTPEDLLKEWGAAWTTRDPGERDRRLAVCTTEDVEFIPAVPERVVTRGRRELADHIAKYSADWPEGVGFDLAGPMQTHHDWSRCVARWTFPTASAAACEIMRIEDGRIATMLVFAETPLLLSEERA